MRDHGTVSVQDAKPAAPPEAAMRGRFGPGTRVDTG
jgi:hypothetical protein